MTRRSFWIYHDRFLSSLFRILIQIVALTMNCLKPMVWVVRACLVWLSLLCFTAAGPDSTISDLAPASEQRTAELRSRDNGKFLLRIMPLGASITLGYKSTDGNGYREWLRRQLRYAGWQVDMVGSMRNGTMHNNVSNNPHSICITVIQMAMH